jgi:hypothetical protein
MFSFESEEAVEQPHADTGSAEGPTVPPVSTSSKYKFTRYVDPEYEAELRALIHAVAEDKQGLDMPLSNLSEEVLNSTAEVLGERDLFTKTVDRNIHWTDHMGKVSLSKRLRSSLLEQRVPADMELTPINRMIFPTQAYLTQPDQG